MAAERERAERDDRNPHPISDSGFGRRCVIVVAIATKPPRTCFRVSAGVCGVSYRSSGRVVYSGHVPGASEREVASDPRMTDPLLAKADATELSLLPALANRHGLITGATGTGKTVTLQTLAEQFSRIGVPVFMADVKGDLSGIGAAGGSNAQDRRAGSGARHRASLRGVPGRVLGRVRRSAATRCARPSPTWARCCSRGCSTSTRRRKAC